MNKMDVLIAYLFAIQAFSKDIHYSVKGEAFYSKHLLADEIYKGIDEQIDLLIETCILPLGQPKQIFYYWKFATKEVIPSLALSHVRNEDLGSFKCLEEMLKMVLNYINELEIHSRAENSLVDSIAQDLQRKLGLITRQVE